MYSRYPLISTTAFVFLALAVLGGCTGESPPDTSETAAESSVERGKYLVEAVMGCPACHTGEDQTGTPAFSERYAGGLEVMDAFGLWRSLNITQDIETGIGGWTDEEIIVAIREGLRPNGERLFPIMPYPLYNRLSDVDAQSIVDYLRTIPAVAKIVERATDLTLPRTIPPPPTGEGPPEGDRVKLGEYITSLMACVDCHTPLKAEGGYNEDRKFAGGFPMPTPPALGTGTIWSSNITPDEETGIAHYSEEQIIAAITSMQKADGSPIRGPMKFYRQGWSRVTQDDLQSVAAFLKSLPPIENRVPEATFKPHPRPAE
ncbi:MAG: cytochrome c [Rhodothermia bacterium]|nr:MAG: cytochrome c [Rhodothermia bacterium]